MLDKRLDELSSSLSNCICTVQEENLSANRAIDLFHEYLLEIKNNNKQVFVIGNGGSAGIASHFANDLLKSLEIPATTFVDSNLVTCISNDYGYEHVYSKPLEIVAKPGDLLIAISSSGQSINIINAVKKAKDKGLKVVTLSGFLENNPLRFLGDLNFWVEKIDYGIVEMAHFILLHTVSDLFPQKLIKYMQQKELTYV